MLSRKETLAESPAALRNDHLNLLVWPGSSSSSRPVGVENKKKTSAVMFHHHHQPHHHQSHHHHQTAVATFRAPGICMQQQQQKSQLLLQQQAAAAAAKEEVFDDVELGCPAAAEKMDGSQQERKEEIDQEKKNNVDDIIVLVDFRKRIKKMFHSVLCALLFFILHFCVERYTRIEIILMPIVGMYIGWHSSISLSYEQQPLRSGKKSKGTILNIIIIFSGLLSVIFLSLLFLISESSPSNLVVVVIKDQQQHHHLRYIIQRCVQAFSLISVSFYICAHSIENKNIIRTSCCMLLLLFLSLLAAIIKDSMVALGVWGFILMATPIFTSWGCFCC